MDSAQRLHAESNNHRSSGARRLPANASAARQSHGEPLSLGPFANFCWLWATVWCVSKRAQRCGCTEEFAPQRPHAKVHTFTHGGYYYVGHTHTPSCHTYDYHRHDRREGMITRRLRRACCVSQAASQPPASDCKLLHDIPSVVVFVCVCVSVYYYYVYCSVRVDQKQNPGSNRTL